MDNKISVFTTDTKYICEASTLLLQKGQGFNKLVNNIYSQIRQIFEFNNVLVNIISSTLHQFCAPASRVTTGAECLSTTWTPNIRSCFKEWSQSLKMKVREPDRGEFLSFVFGEGQKISQVSDQVSLALTEYNKNFQALSEHENRVDFNLNSLSQMTQNITKYEKELYTSNLISSLLSQANFKRLFSSLRITNIIQQLTYILQTAGINALLAKLSN